MANADNQALEKAPMTIKAVPVETRRDMLALATKQGLSMAEWLAQTVAHMKRLQDGERVLPPLVPGKPGAGLPVVQPVSPFGGTVHHMSVGELAEAMRAAVSIAETSGVPLPKTHATQALRYLHERIRMARGFPEKTPGKTRAKNGQTTIEHAPPEEGGLPEKPVGKTEAQNGQTMLAPAIEHAPEGGPGHEAAGEGPIPRPPRDYVPPAGRR